MKPVPEFAVNVVLPDRYHLHDEPLLGSGGMGQVLKVQDVVLDVPVALKVVRPDLAQDRRFRKLFNLEVRMSARLVHPRVVPLHDHGDLPDGTPYLGLALANAGSMAKLRNEGCEWGELRRLIIELLDGLSHLHARDVLHRDLKPENVLLHSGDDGLRHVWLADLGLANAASDLMRTKGRMEGTPGFMSPEQKLGLPREYGPWTDLYSLGVMIWEICTGERPFADGETSAERDLPEFIPRIGMNVPASLPRILSNLLSPEPLSRYDLAADLRTELEALEGPSLSRDDYSNAIVGTGTVAPSASGVHSNISLVDDSEQVNRTLFSFTASDLSPDGKDRRIPDWNRPLPPPLLPAPPVLMDDAGHARASVSLFALRDPPLVFRDEPRLELWEHARAVQESGQARVVVIVGPVGSGTSRLMRSVALDLEEGGWAEPVSLSWTSPAGADDGYAGAARALLRPWNESRASLESRLRRRLARERDRYDSTIEAEADLLVRWCGLLNDNEDPVAVGLGLREVYRHLDARSWRGLSMLLLDDPDLSVEEGDGLAIAEAMLASEEAGVGDKPILVVAAISSERLSGDLGLASRLEALIRSGAHRIDLKAFSSEQTRALLNRSISLDPQLAERVVERCQGNPLFARQLLLEWVNRGWLVDTGGLVFGLSDEVEANAVLPTDAKALFDQQLQRLAQASGQERRFRDTVHMAALVGRSLPAALLLDLGGEGLEDFLSACELWVARDDRMEFQSRLHHEAFASLAEERSDVSYLHRRIGRAWMRLGEGLGIDVGIEVGRHASRGRDYPLALEHLMGAAKRAHLSGRPARMLEATTLAQEVVAADEDLAEQGGMVDLWAGRAHRVTGDAVTSGRCFERALRHATFMGDTQLAIEARCGVGWIAMKQGNLDVAETAWGMAVQMSKEVDDPGLQAMVISGKAWLEQQKRNFDGADILFTRAVNRLLKIGDERGVAEATLGQAFVARRTGAFSDAHEMYEESIDAFRRAEDPLGIARAILGNSIAFRQLGKREESETLLRESLALCEELGAIQLVQDCCLAMADLYRDGEERQKARSLYRDHLAWSEQRSIFESRIAAHLALARMALADGDLAGCHEEATAAVQMLNEVAGHWLWATYRLLVAAMLAERNDGSNTWKWLWHAQELGLKDTVDRDNCSDLERIFVASKRNGWDQSRRLSGRLLLRQLIRLGEHARAQDLQSAMDEG